MIELIYGGSGSGKSEFAEKRILKISSAYPESKKYYLATMKPYGFDAEQRIQRHKKLREGKGFTTLEKSSDLSELRFTESGSILLECAGNLIANEMFQDTSIYNSQFVAEKVFDDIMFLIKNTYIQNLIIVSNNIFDDGIHYDASTMEYIRAMAFLNCKLTAVCDTVVEVVAGIPLVIKGDLNC